jgi:hypothetical protein
MTTIRQFLVFGLSVLLMQVQVLRAQESQGRPAVTIAIMAVNPVAVLGTDVTISIKMTNISDENIVFIGGYRGSLPDGYGYEIRNEQGGLVQRFGPRYVTMPNGEQFRLPTRSPGTTRWGNVLPGGSTETRATLSDDFNFESPGTYTIRVWSVPVLNIPEGMDPNAQGVGKAYSNTVTIKLLPPDSSSQPQQ